jgi:hypothetical protein
VVLSARAVTPPCRVLPQSIADRDSKRLPVV